MGDRSQEPKTRKGRNDRTRTVTDAASQGRSLSQHEGVPLWCDCCPCEAEPYWVEVAEELGIDLDAPGEDGEARERRRKQRGKGDSGG